MNCEKETYVIVYLSHKEIWVLNLVQISFNIVELLIKWLCEMNIDIETFPEESNNCIVKWKGLK